MLIARCSPGKVAAVVTTRAPGQLKTTLRLTLLAAFAVGTMAAPGRASAEGSAIRIRVITGEILSLLYFAESIIDTPTRTTYLREIYRRHRGAAQSSAAQSSVAQIGATKGDPAEMIREALASIPSGIAFFAHGNSLPTGRHQGNSMLAIFEIIAANSNGLEDFARRTAGLLPITTHTQLIGGLTRLQQIHRRLVWNPSRGFLATAKRKLQRLFRKIRAGTLLQRIATFYGTRWPEGLPITVALVPIPGKSYEGSHTYAHSVDAYEFVEVLQKDDLENRLGVLIHEICHSLYDAQPLDLQRRLEFWFLKSTSDMGPFAYSQINEALATAIGNGHVNSLLKGDEAHHTSWYADRVIRDFAKEIYPRVKSYLGRHKTIDRGLVDEAVRKFAKAFPDAHSSPQILLSKIHLFVDGPFDGRKILRTLRKDLHIPSSYLSSPLDHPRTMENFARSSTETLLFFVSRGGVAKLRSYPFSKRIKPILIRAFKDNKPFVFATKLQGRMAIFVGVPDGLSALAIASRLAKQDRIAKDRVTSLMGDPG